MQVYYLQNNKKTKTSVSNKDMEVLSSIKDNRQIVKIKALEDITLLGADHYLGFAAHRKDQYFLNGYQSWTDTAEYYLSKRLRNVKKSTKIWLTENFFVSLQKNSHVRSNREDIG